MELNVAARRIHALPTGPVAAHSAYEAWHSTRPRNGQGRQALSANDYSRIATLRRAGHSFNEIGRLLGRSASGYVKKAFERLPEALR